ncbi:sigma-70 family RNA polymerase sigma factor [Arthrobacter sp. FW305-123]|nr:sigma-70 family RNA polymerase sigma factor [Arthrobacter sp. FW305-123]
MARVSHASDKISFDDGQLIELVRSGDMSAFDGLYERHVQVASKVARRNVDNQSDAEDVVAEAFQSVLQSLVSGKGPDTFFRAYLLSTVSRLSHQRNRKAGRVLPSGDDSVLDQTLADVDPAIGAFESHTVAKAFRALPERWQAVLWYLDVERMKPAAVAPILGLSANAVSALALRAREGLRRQYLQFHVADQADSRCSEYASKLGNYIRGGVSSATERRIREHLDGCAACTAALAELRDVQGTMRAVLLPLVTGIPAALWAGKGAGLGMMGSMVPAKMAGAVPALAQPAVMALVATTALGLVLGALGVVDHLTPDSYTQQRAVESAVSPRDTTPVTPVPSPTSTPAPAAPQTVVPPVVPQPVDVQLVDVPPEPQEPAGANPVPATPAEPSAAASPAPPTVTTPSAMPVVVPPTVPPVVVDASARRAGDRERHFTVMEIDFKVSGSRTLRTVKAVFSVEKSSWIVEDSVKAPEGWNCSFEGRSVVSCSSDSVQPADLHFQIGTGSKRNYGHGDKDEGVLTYSLSGQGVASKRFSAVY